METEDQADGRSEWTPPYIAWRTLLNLIERLETTAVPPQIDKTFLTGSNQSNTQTINALKSLGLIKDDGSVTPSLIRLVEAGTERPAAVQKVLEGFFQEAIQLGKVNATHRQLDMAFEDYGVSGSTRRKAVSFYLKAASYAQMSLSPHFKTPLKSSGPRKRRRSIRGVTPPASAPASSSVTDASLPALKARYIEMLMEKANGQDELDAELLDRIENLLDFEPLAADE